jgi:ribosomal protein S18 acetylase RimI-like enzyme
VSFVVRRANGAADYAFVRDLGRASVMSSVGDLRPTTQTLAIAAFDRLDDIVKAQSHIAFVATEDGHPVGFVLLLDELPDEVTLIAQGFIAYMAVDPDRRGAGIGRALLAAAESEARRLGLPYMALMVTEENAAARRLYERAGYRTERRLLCKAL